VDKAPDRDTAPDMNAAAAPVRTSEMLAVLGDTAAGESVSFDDLLDQFRQRAFGAMLLVVLLPTFIPVPVGIGAITGPFIALLGLQMLFTLQHPWLPRWLGRRTMKRASVQRFGNRFRPLLARIERICKPRLLALVEHRAAHAFTGLQLVLLGFLLSLPIPGTNYPFGLILLLYCIGLIERDGVVLLIGWVLGIGAIVASAALSNEAIDMLARLWT
jgi:hypothetical protein